MHKIIVYRFTLTNSLGLYAYPDVHIYIIGSRTRSESTFYYAVSYDHSV